MAEAARAFLGKEPIWSAGSDRSAWMAVIASSSETPQFDGILGAPQAYSFGAVGNIFGHENLCCGLGRFCRCRSIQPLKLVVSRDDRRCSGSAAAASRGS